MKSTCSTWHGERELSFSADAPDQWQSLTDEERARSELGPEHCVIESSQGREYFVRAYLEIPIRTMRRYLTLGVWVSVSETSFAQVTRHPENPDRAGTEVCSGWLCTRVPGYMDTTSLK